ncbi:MAG: hypothetical protein GX129_06805 [Clostridiales bacterium]|nr:hypothetical protein [Clostridiales bacterium]
MRLFHVSEESNIETFEPRKPSRTDIDNSKGLIWAINEQCLPNFLTPRDCPRVAYYYTDRSTDEDKSRFFSSPDIQHVIAIESKWFEAMINTSLYLYEFDTSDFILQDEIAGYYISDKEQKPVNKIVITNIFKEIFDRNIELRIIPNLWDLADDIKTSTLNWSLCRMGNAEKR